MRPRVLLVASEAIPLVKTGGLADVVSAMAGALRAQDIDVTLLLPGYGAALEVLGAAQEVARLEELPCGSGRLLLGRVGSANIPVLLLDTDAFRARTANPYVDHDGNEFADNALAFASLAHAAVRICAGQTPLPVPHVVHANDWHAALIPALLHAAGIDNVGTVLTIHNLAFQGNYPMELAARIGLPASMTGPDGAEFWGRLNFLKAGIRYADRISIVSRSYAQEVLTPRFGCGLEGALAARRDAIVAIANGVDVDVWNPATDPAIARRFGVDTLRNKAYCKRALLSMFDLPMVPEAPLIALGSRITHQKMADVALEALPQVLDAHPRLQVVVLGCGEHGYEDGFRELAARYPGRVGVHIGYDEQRAHALHAGADMLLHGTRFEPFGLTPIYAMRYGTIPVASRVGGIVDTIPDAGSIHAPAEQGCGVLFDGEQAGDMAAALERALTLYSVPLLWNALQRNAMRAEFSWDGPTRDYIALYADIAPEAARELFVPRLLLEEPEETVLAVA